MSKPKILIVDDERSARLSLVEILRMEGYDVLEADGGQAAILLIKANDFDVVVCDLKMPDVDGIKVLEECQAQRPLTKFILLTAYGTLDSAVDALRHSAADYLLKPAPPEIILTSVRTALENRLQALARQSLMGVLADTVAALKDDVEQAPAPKPDALLRGGGIVLNLDARQAEHDGAPLQLTPTEFDMLAYLMLAAGKPVSAEELVAHVHGYSPEPDEASALVRVHIRRLRQKIELNAADPRLVLTVRGVGYAFTQDVQPAGL